MSSPVAYTEIAAVPLKWVGPLPVWLSEGLETLWVPLATYESPLWPSTRRGALVAGHSGGVRCTVLDDRMTRSILLEAAGAAAAQEVVRFAKEEKETLQTWTAETSRFARLIDVHAEIVGPLLFLRLAFQTGDASGHNMSTKAAERILRGLVDKFPGVTEVSVSGNLCCDKKVSAVNGLLGRGKSVVAEALIPERIVRRHLKTTAQAVADLNLRKNLLGSILAGGVRSANAHVANLLLAFYLATGQDAANIVEGSQAIVHAEDRAGDLYFSLSLPNLIVGTVGNGKGLPFVEEALTRLGCRAERAPGENARRLAQICAATAWCGELSLLAALTCPGELMAAHQKLERA